MTTDQIVNTESGSADAVCADTATVAAVVIGRNEGERLKQCLESLVGSVAQVVYVDSGSTDGSCELAMGLGVQVVSLDLSIPFTAARARNEGMAAIVADHPGIEFVQLVDGDCAVAGEWIDHAWETINSDDRIAIVCGRRRERYPEATRWNQLCDMEWDGPAGDVIACGGDALVRVSAFDQVGGFDPSLIAGEEPEMCVRLRAQEWRIVRIDHDMTWHDAAMTKFGQWWKRAERSGHAYAEGNYIHGMTPERFRRREVRSIIFWGGIVPLVALAAAVPTLGASILLAAAGYTRLYRKIKQYRQSSNCDSPENAGLYARATLLGKLPQFLGLLRFRINRLRRRQAAIIEYK